MSLTVLSRSRAFLQDGAYVTDPVLTDGAATYTPGVSERRGAATTFLHSGLKNADAKSGTSQAVVASRQYDAFGNLVASSGTWSGPVGYAGGFGYQEDATGLRLLGHRYYDSSTGRFLTRDPIKDGRNWYSYCENDPVNGTDPDGLNVIDIIRRGIARGDLPPGTADRYRKDPGFRERIHREIGERKKGGFGGRKNLDLPEEEVIDVVQEQLEYRVAPQPSPSSGVDWGLVGRGALVVGVVIVGGLIIVGSGGTATGPVLAGSAAAVGGILVAPQIKSSGGA